MIIWIALLLLCPLLGVRSLSELAASHCLVKVQLNGVKDNPEAAEAAAAELERQAAGAVTLLQVGGQQQHLPTPSAASAAANQNIDVAA